MLSEGIIPIGDGLLEVAEERLRGLLMAEDIHEIYDVEQTPFARGKFAAVRRAIHKKSGVHFAAKFLRRRRRAQCSDKEIKHEIAVLILCSGSENIVNLNAVHETRSDTALLLELATGGELQAILDDEGSLTEAQTRICMRQVLKALQYLHKRSIAHLDLKPQNILLTGKKVEDGLKLCDFGISRIIENGSKIREILGTPDYVAPEVLQYEPLSLLTDIWSVGVLTYVLLSGCSPFGGDTKQETFLNISQCSLTFPDELFRGVSEHAIDFIKSTLRIKPNERMTAFDCLEHIWLKEESPIGNTFLVKSSTSSGVTENEKELNNDSQNIKGNNYNDDDDDRGVGVGEHYNNITTTSSSRQEKAVENFEQRFNSTHNNIRKNVQDTIIIHDNKENFLRRHTSSTGYNSPTNSLYNSSTKYGLDISTTTTGIQTTTATAAVTTKINIAAQQSKYRTNINTNKYCINKYSRNSDSCTLIKNHHNSYHHHNHHNKIGLNEIEIVHHNNFDKIRDLTKTTTSHTTKLNSTTKLLKTNGTTAATATSITTSQICLFPDAPTTPKVLRKAPSESPKSVKALVKKFQLETNEIINSSMTTSSTTSATTTAAATTITQQLIKDNNSDERLDIIHKKKDGGCCINNGSSSRNVGNGGGGGDGGVVKKLINHNNHNKNTISNNNCDDNSSTNYKSRCIFCLTCSGPGCRHSGSTNVNKSSANLSIDQGIIC